MTTKVVDSTVSQLLQDNSSVEYVAPETNPIATIPNADTPSRKSEDTPLFDFNAEHNGIQCIESLKPEDRGTERQFWFSARMLATVFDCADPKTVRSRIETLVNTGDLDEGKNFLSSQMPYSNGSVHDLDRNGRLLRPLRPQEVIGIAIALKGKSFHTCVENEKKPLVSDLILEVFSSQWSKI